MPSFANTNIRRERDKIRFASTRPASDPFGTKLSSLENLIDAFRILLAHIYFYLFFFYFNDFTREMVKVGEKLLSR